MQQVGTPPVGSGSAWPLGQSAPRPAVPVAPPPRPISAGASLMLMLGHVANIASWIMLLASAIVGWLGWGLEVALLTLIGSLVFGAGLLGIAGGCIGGVVLKNRLRRVRLGWGYLVGARQVIVDGADGKSNLGIGKTFSYRDAEEEARLGLQAPVREGYHRSHAQPPPANQELPLLWDPESDYRLYPLDNLPNWVVIDSRGWVATRSGCVPVLLFAALLVLIGANLAWIALTIIA